MKNLLTFLVLFVISFNAHALKQEDLLHPDKAFQVSATAIDGNNVRLTWEVAEGYYLYRERLSFTSGNEGISLLSDTASYPKGDLKDDPTFGETEVYHKTFSIDIPLTRQGDALNAAELALKTKYQGCADAGLCYPPQRKTVTVPLPVLATTDNTTGNNENLTQNKTTAPEAPLTTDKDKTTKTTPGGTSSTKALSSDEALRFSLEATDKRTLRARWEILPGHHLYRNKINFSASSPDNAQLGDIQFPEGRIVNDEFFGEVEIYDQNIDIAIPLLTSDIEELTIQAQYQGCSNDARVCYPPINKEITLSLAGLPEQSASAESGFGSGVLTEEYFSGSFIGTLSIFFIIGLGLSLTPCIFPMIPILSGIVAGQANLSANKAFLLSLVYVTASATAYALIGLAFGFFGENLQASLQHPVAIGLFAALFVVLAFSMFGFFELQMPNRIQSRLNEISSNQRGGSLLGAAIMGFLSTLIVGPCVAPALAAALTYIADTKDALLGASALFSMGFGMGVILLVVGTLGGHLLPKAGGWMDVIKSLFGIMLLGMAIWMLSRITSTTVTMLLIGTLLVSSGIYMGALDKLHEETTGWDRFWKSIGLILLFFGFAQLIGVVLGNQNIMHPLKGSLSFTVAGESTAGNTSQHQGLVFRQVKNVSELDAVLSQAKQSEQLVMLDFYADWCIDCIRMEKNVFTVPEVGDDLSNVIILQADVTVRDEHSEGLEKRFGIVGPPTIIFFDTQGQEIRGLRMIGYEDTPAFRKRLKQFTQNQ
ncbi:MAG: Cytochrome c-type biogenesis protein DsbD, protein-disulfide reductase (EC [uncultured Thiotrichaceae bacterium]|uniref:Cytochrome c-type biogenesis protein DsbD, protein-disulfide reductase (EC) n=1 Tax=uncultured Thiotrichaceae bacterium TaxID=298394 RepID=A0A6S6TY53_9GAMM|nr:MAG: Cytochrome c-type biogenesis protein DsbD, protein-disulfide reductase (EC [uncultured Thiotrichaceae bacterium]